MRMIYVALVLIIIAGATAAAIRQPAQTQKDNVRIAFVGNSIQYFYDIPRLLTALESIAGTRIAHDCCFRGGASYTSLLAKGSGMARVFPAEDIGAPTVESLLEGATWDFCVMNDFTTHPARDATREESIITLVERYAPMLTSCGATPILIMTYAYRQHVTSPRTDDLGSHGEWTRQLRDGLSAHALALGAALPPEHAPRVAPLGTALLSVHDDNPALWTKLFDPDHRHLSAKGAYLLACVLHCTIFWSAPPTDAALAASGFAPLYENARYLPDVGEYASPPTPEEAAYLRSVADSVCLPWRTVRRHE